VPYRFWIMAIAPRGLWRSSSRRGGKSGRYGVGQCMYLSDCWSSKSPVHLGSVRELSVYGDTQRSGPHKKFAPLSAGARIQRLVLSRLLGGRVPPKRNVRVFGHYMRRPSGWPTRRCLEDSRRPIGAADSPFLKNNCISISWRKIAGPCLLAPANIWQRKSDSGGCKSYYRPWSSWSCPRANKNVGDELNYANSTHFYAGVLISSFRARMAVLWWRRRRKPIRAAQTDPSAECRKLEKGVDVSHGRDRPRRRRHRPASHCAV